MNNCTLCRSGLKCVSIYYYNFGWGAGVKRESFSPTKTRPPSKVCNYFTYIYNMLYILLIFMVYI